MVTCSSSLEAAGTARNHFRNLIDKNVLPKKTPLLAQDFSLNTSGYFVEKQLVYTGWSTGLAFEQSFIAFDPISLVVNFQQLDPSASLLVSSRVAKGLLLAGASNRNKNTQSKPLGVEISFYTDENSVRIGDVYFGVSLIASGRGYNLDLPIGQIEVSKVASTPGDSASFNAGFVYTGRLNSTASIGRNLKNLLKQLKSLISDSNQSPSYSLYVWRDNSSASNYPGTVFVESVSLVELQ